MADATGEPLPTIAAALDHAKLQTTAAYTTAAGPEALDFLAKNGGVRHAPYDTFRIMFCAKALTSNRFICPLT